MTGHWYCVAANGYANLCDNEEHAACLAEAMDAQCPETGPHRAVRLVEAKTPIDMVLHCPACGLQHIDAPEQNDRYLARSDPPAEWFMPPWSNRPHRSHLCHGCGHIWRPADVPTNGVLAVKTTGKADSPIATLHTVPGAPSPVAQPAREPLTRRQIVKMMHEEYCGNVEDFAIALARAIERAHKIGAKE